MYDAEFEHNEYIRALNKIVAAQIKANHPLKSHPYYLNTESVVIGYGRKLNTTGITRHEAEILLRHDIQRIREELENNFSWWWEVDDARQSAIINIVYNIGLHNFCKHEKLIEHIRTGAWYSAGDEMRSNPYINLEDAASVMRYGDQSRYYLYPNDNDPA